MSQRKQRSERHEAYSPQKMFVRHRGRVIWCFLLILLAVAVVTMGYLTIRNDRANLAGTTDPNRGINHADSNGDEPLVIVKTARIRERQAEYEAGLDPGRDGWETEVLADLAKSNLDRILQILAGGRSVLGRAIGDTRPV